MKNDRITGQHLSDSFCSLSHIWDGGGQLRRRLDHALLFHRCLIELSHAWHMARDAHAYTPSYMD